MGRGRGRPDRLGATRQQDRLARDRGSSQGWARSVILVLAVAALLTSCGGGDGDKTVTRTDYEAKGLDWPLSEEEVTIRCDGNALVLIVNDEEFALNGFARQKGYQQAVGVDVGAIQEVAQESC